MFIENKKKNPFHLNVKRIIIYKIQWMIIGTQVIPLYKSIFSLWSYIRT